jgi:hypothetical protein
MKSLILLATIISCLLGYTLADTPANCTYEDIRGRWVFSEGPRRFDKTLKCDQNTPQSEWTFNKKTI